MPTLDLATVHICSILLSSAFGAMFVARWRRERERYLLIAAESALLYAAVLAGLGAIPQAPLPTGLLVGLLALSTTLLLAAARSFDRAREVDGWVVVPPIACALAYTLPSLLPNGGDLTVAIRVLNSLALAATMLATALMILRRPTAAPASARLVAFALLGYLPCYALSIALSLGLGTARDWLAVVPMMADQALLGVLNVGLLAMSGERDAASLRGRALRDPLTGAWNRAGLDALAGRFGHDGAVIAIDIDHFKQINDRHGHAAGDAVLRTLAAAIVSKLPQGAELARFGGDEFVLALPIADQARPTAERILAIGVGNGTGACWSTSIGIGRIAAGDSGLAPAIARADTMLYRAKAAGRAQIAA